MLIGLFASQNLNEELVTVFFDAEHQALWVFQEFGEDGIRVAQSCAIDAVVLQIALHQRVQALEQLQF